MKLLIPGSDDSPSQPPPRVLVVEDELGFAAALCIGLRSDGYVVQSASSVREAQTLLEREPVDLLIIDWLLPDGTGDQVCETARASRPSMPIIVITGLADAYHKAIHQCQPNFYLTKPLSLVQLFSNVRALVN